MVCVKGHVGEHVVLGLFHQRSKRGEAHSQPVGDGASLLARSRRAGVDTLGKRLNTALLSGRPTTSRLTQPLW
jgi:hypothetical protein